MNPDLMGPAGFQLTLDQAETIRRIAFDYFPVGYRILGMTGLAAHLFALGRMAANRLPDYSRVAFRAAVDQGQVDSVNTVSLELGRKLLVTVIVLGDDQNARGVLVDPVNDSRAQFHHRYRPGHHSGGAGR